MNHNHILTWVRHLAGGCFAWYAAQRVLALDHASAARRQRATLLRLVQHSQSTRFGRDHDFGRIRSIQDYHCRVPLRDYEAFWKDYWQPAFPYLVNVTWPGLIPYFALSSGTATGKTKYIPVSREMLASNRLAAWTTLGLFLAAYPRSQLFSGRIFFLGGSTDLHAVRNTDQQTDAGPNVRVGDLSAITACEVPAIFRPFAFPPLEQSLTQDWDRKVQILAERSAGLPITVLTGVPSWLLVLFERLKRVTGGERIADIWPTLRLVVHGGTRFDPYRSLFRREIGSDSVHFLETYPCSEGFVASEDPRHGLLRLIHDHDIFFEFVPVQELDCDKPRRHTIAEVVPGIQYAVALTTCAGLWSYLVGDTICFERRDPPLLRFTGRTRCSLSAFGEHLIGEEIEIAVARAAAATDAAVADFHVGPVFPEQAGLPGRHRYLIEFVQAPVILQDFASELDRALCSLNEDYKAHRQGELSLGRLEVWPVRRGGFTEWLRWRGQLGGQHKVPRIDSRGEFTAELCRWFRELNFVETI